MNVIYRVSAFAQKNKSPVYAEDKWKLVEMCHNSFQKAKQDEPVTYILDRCPQWADYFSKFGKVINREGGEEYDVLGSVTHMFDVAHEMKGKILMLEDDYFWREGTLKHIWRGLDEFKLVSPYDHPYHYIAKDHADFKWKLRLVDGIVWRNALSNTHTFGTTSEYMEENWHIFRRRQFDDPFFKSLPDHIWMPIPSLATHMVKGLLAPSVDWEKLYQV